ncbi:PTS glucose transporter subunit IIA, partial [Salmonella enterica subsp. enterica serovar Infantis]
YVHAVPFALSLAELVSTITGVVVSLDLVADEALGSFAVGVGVAVKPPEITGVSPASGSMVKIFNSHHGVCLETD